ncbi:Uncharacterised protein [Neisseria gonorrhoeae]|uniref:Uncharacterized protein n=1 Tax=Neisseria gonorrhoeae TaxID=485 RepID=A0A378W214_NEIGO|nr:Uncharacterised protein [Neisseria gonorrhoeae]
MEQIMRLTKYPYNSIRELEDYLINTYQNILFYKREEKRFIDVYSFFL